MESSRNNYVCVNKYMGRTCCLTWEDHTLWDAHTGSSKSAAGAAQAEVVVCLCGGNSGTTVSFESWFWLTQNDEWCFSSRVLEQNKVQSTLDLHDTWFLETQSVMKIF